MSAIFATSSSSVAVLKELYVDNSDYMRDLVYAENPWFALVPKNEDADGFAGKYIPVPIQYANGAGRSHTFANAQNNQTPNQYDSFFVYVIQDYQLVTITNLLIEQTKSNAGAFVDEMKREMDGGIRNLTNNVAFELFGSGTATRGTSTSSSTQSGTTAAGTNLPLSNSQAIVNFEVGMTLVASATDGGAPSTDTVTLTNVDRATGIILGTASAASLSGNWAIGTGIAYLTVQGDVPAGGGSGSGPLGSTGSYLALTGLAGWIPGTSPNVSTDSFWGVNRGTDPTRLAGLRYNATSYTIEEGMTLALAFLNREGGRPDLCIMDFLSYANLVNSLGAKVQYVEIRHDEVDVAFEGVRFHSAYGYVTVLADRSCPPQTAYVLTTETWKLRSLGKVPHILTYGIEGLEGLRVGTSDALEVRIGYYGNLVCSGPGLNMVVSLSA